jgi:hypothetical protein
VDGGFAAISKNNGSRRVGSRYKENENVTIEKVVAMQSVWERRSLNHEQSRLLRRHGKENKAYTSYSG